MLKKRIIISLTFLNGVLFRTKKFIPDYRYTKKFINLWNIDELILIDISKKKFSKEFLNIVEYFSSNCFVPISVGGGITNLNDAKIFFEQGADKIIVGSRGILDQEINKKISAVYGNQSLIQAFDFYKINDNYVLFSDSGQKNINKNLYEAISSVNYEHIGEVFLNNIENDGSMLGFDVNVIKEVEKRIERPIIILGGGGNWMHFLDAFSKANTSAACTQNIYHFTEESIKSLKKYLLEKKINIRETV